jgi:hypothetical protein
MKVRQRKRKASMKTKFFTTLLICLPITLFAKSQYSDIDFLPMKCDLKLAGKSVDLNFEKQEIGRYHISLITFVKDKKKYTLSALGSMLDGKCLAYFYSFNPETEMFEVRLKYSETKNNLSGKFYYKKEDESWNGVMTCQLEEKYKEKLPLRCIPATVKARLNKKKKKKVYKLSPPQIGNPSEEGSRKYGTGSKSRSAD